MKWICCLVLTYKLTLTLIMELEENERVTRGGGKRLGTVCQTQKPHAREKLKKLFFRYLSFWSEIELELFVEGQGIIGFSSLSHSQQLLGLCMPLSLWSCFRGLCSEHQVAIIGDFLKAERFLKYRLLL